jgi:hypothetical protein
MADRLDLDRELRQLASRVAFPDAPDLSTAVGWRVAALRADRRDARRGRRWQRVSVAAAALVVIVGAVLAISPQARSAAADLFDVVGIDLRFGSSGGDAPPLGENLRLGPELGLGEARRRVGFRIRTAGAFDERPEVHVNDDIVSLVYDDVLVTQFAAGFGEDLVVKEVGSAATVEAVELAPGVTAHWISGEPHRLFLSDDTTGEVRTETLRLATDTLVWAEDGVTYRVEGDLPLPDALRIARSLRA